MIHDQLRIARNPDPVIEIEIPSQPTDGRGSRRYPRGKSVVTTSSPL